MIERLRKLPARFFMAASGREPVREWIQTLSPGDRKRMDHAIRDCEFSWPIGLPLCRQLSGHKGVWEIRADLSAGKTGRVIFSIRNSEMILLHGFVKKAQKTPKRDLETAIARRKELGDE